MKDMLPFVVPVGTIVVAIIGTIFGKQALDAKDATVALLERTLKAKDDEKATVVLGLQQQIKYYELVAPTKMVDDLNALTQLAEGRAEGLKRVTEEKVQRETELQAEIARLKDEGAQAAAVAKEEALRQVQTRMSELQSEIARLQTLSAASGEVAAFIDAQPDYRDPRWQHYQPPVTRQSLREHTSAFSLGEAVPREIRERFERCLTTYRASYENYGLLTTAAEQAWLVIEPAVHLRLQDNPQPTTAARDADNRRRPVGLRALLEMAVSDGLLSRQWPIDAICARRNLIVHPTDTETITPPMALQTFREVADLVNELWADVP